MKRNRPRNLLATPPYHWTYALDYMDKGFSLGLVFDLEKLARYPLIIAGTYGTNELVGCAGTPKKLPIDKPDFPFGSIRIIR